VCSTFDSSSLDFHAIMAVQALAFSVEASASPIPKCLHEPGDADTDRHQRPDSHRSPEGESRENHHSNGRESNSQQPEE
jgi:hypothetical protein